VSVALHGHGSSQRRPLQVFVDPWMLGIVLALISVGVVFVFSASVWWAQADRGDPYFYLRREVLYVLIGLTFMTLGWAVDYRRLAVYRKWIFGLAVFGMMATFMPGLRVELNNANRWIDIGMVTVQPIEFAKIAVIVYMASFFVRRQDRIQEFWRGLFPPLVVMGFMVAIAMRQPDFGGAMIMVAVTALLFVIAGASLVQMFALLAIATSFATVAVGWAGYRQDRLTAFLNPEADPLGSGYQLLQSLYAFGHGGLSGVGLGESVQKAFYLPESFSDFILAIVGEELGLIGTLVLLGLLALFFVRGMVIARYARDEFGYLLASGLTLLITVEGAINAAVVMGALPTKGLTFPFVSYGGSSLMMSCFLVGVLLNIYRQGELARRNRAVAGA